MNLCKLLSTDGFLTGWVSLREGATVIGVRTMVQCWIHINYMKLLAAVLALKYLVCVSPSGYDFVTAWKMHQILVASRWLAKSWEVEITRLWHLALHRERPSKSGKVLHSRPELSLERSNLLAPGVPKCGGDNWEWHHLPEASRPTNPTATGLFLWPTVYSTRGRLTSWSICEWYLCHQVVLTTLLFHFIAPIVA